MVFEFSGIVCGARTSLDLGRLRLPLFDVHFCASNYTEIGTTGTDGCSMREVLFVAGIALGLIITAAWTAFLAFEFVELFASFL
jgi:hypothetical protein